MLYEEVLNITIIREMQIKSTTKCRLTLIRLATSKEHKKVNIGKDAEKLVPVHCWWECKMVQVLWETVWRFLKKN